MPMMHKNQSVDVHRFAMVPQAEIPRSTFLKQFTHKTTFDENYLIPIFVDEVLPGDTFSVNMTGFARLTTPIFPLMDQLYLDSFFFFVPNRLTWYHWVNFQGQQTNPADSISYTIPQITVNASGYATNSIFDYFGLPTTGQVTVGRSVPHSALPLRAYNAIWNQWFRDENLQNSVADNSQSDGPDIFGNYALLKRGKRHDYFTSALPWTQKGGVAVTVPLGGSAIVKTSASAGFTGAQQAMQMLTSGTGANPGAFGLGTGGGTGGPAAVNSTAFASSLPVYPSNLYADLTTATSATINQLRLAFQTQRLLERDARGGTRYTEIVRAHFGVISPDARLQRPEYLGGGSVPVNIAPIPQTSATGLTGGSTPQGNLSAYGTVLSRGNGFSQSFTEHGYIIGLINIRADLTYQQGLRNMWSRLTRYDFYMPVFAEIGEQAILNQEIYAGQTTDTAVFGYQERWGDYRYFPSMVTGQFNSTYVTPLDAWHLAEKFTALPTLGATFIQQNTPIARVSASATAGAHFIGDFFFNIKCTRPMPLYSVPGHMDHF